MINKSFGKRLRKLREDRGLTREKLAEGISVTSTSIYNIENGDQWVSPGTLEKLSAFLNVSPAVFFTDDVVKVEPTPQEALVVISEALNSKDKKPDSINRSTDEIVEIFSTLDEDQKAILLGQARRIGSSNSLKANPNKVVKRK